MAIKLNWQRRSVVMLAAFTLILGFILITLAVREAERERIAQEKVLEGEKQRYGALLKGEMDSLFSEMERKIRAALADVPTQPDLQKLSEAIRLEAENEALLGDIFLVDGNNDLVLPLRNSLFLTSERRRLAGINLERMGSIGLFKSAESAELITNNLPLAIQSYKTLVNSVQDNSSRALVLNRLARCYKKSGNLNQAFNTYKTILKDFSHEMSSEGVALGIIAFYQIGSITQKLEPEKVGKIILEFYDRFVDSEWPLDKAQFQFYRSIIAKMEETWKSEWSETSEDADFMNQWDELGRRADSKLRDLEADEVLLGRIVPLVQTRLLEFESGPAKFNRFSENIDDMSFLISAVFIQKEIILGIHINNSVLVEERLPQILDRLLIPADWLVQIVDSDGQIVFGTEAVDLETTDRRSPFVMGFDQDFPPWQVSISQLYPNASEKQFNLRRNIYILVVVVVMALLFFGGFMAIKSTAKELELARLKSEFVSTVSHEFRTPLMSIRYLSEMLDSGRVKGEDKKSIYYGKISKESERLSRLIENMLDFSKIEAGMKKYLFEELSVADLVNDVIQRFEEYAADKHVTLKCEISDPLPNIHADREGIFRALFNLLDNAVKYSGKDPLISFRARLDGEVVLLEVQDRGCGISKDEQNKVFEKFYRSVDPVQKSIEGSGIGLTLVDHIVKAHGGEVVLKSDLGKGTRVTLKLPVSQKGKDHG